MQNKIYDVQNAANRWLLRVPCEPVNFRFRLLGFPGRHNSILISNKEKKNFLFKLISRCISVFKMVTGCEPAMWTLDEDCSFQRFNSKSRRTSMSVSYVRPQRVEATTCQPREYTMPKIGERFLIFFLSTGDYSTNTCWFPNQLLFVSYYYLTVENQYYNEHDKGQMDIFKCFFSFFVILLSVRKTREIKLQLLSINKFVGLIEQDQNKTRNTFQTAAFILMCRTIFSMLF